MQADDLILISVDGHICEPRNMRPQSFRTPTSTEPFVVGDEELRLAMQR